jgi:undecaprenyl phosphate-alpha-L-ara4N flippase subunit ArnE
MKLLTLATLQCLLLSGGQICLKFAVARIGGVASIGALFHQAFTNWWLLASGGCMAGAMALYLYLFKHFEFSVAYPVTSLSYVFGMLAAVFIFHEAVPLMRWAGVLLIMVGVFLIAK